MAIRSAVKTIVIKDGCILLIKYISEKGFVHYGLPGGGQEQFENMEETAKREFLEETGYQIKLKRFAAIAEEIFEDKELRKEYPNYVHRIHHIFQGELIEEDNVIGTCGNIDTNQVGCEWIPIEKVSKIYLIPRQVKENLIIILNSSYPIYLGTTYEKANFK
ncbi:NUDIX domain-containing protein [Natranaerovirga pectinivora]|uniref:NUDIX domain-containing protein n=1 Tax=Natranaerovirga pectinivora TaxID=682400 RepID=A0A4R3MRS6_9FIRM|nr:NUDIX domain-containing protein [Natranaerovirga pectinivora]TCT17213.1 NUDIX domain-containing protein [Natranaerovirga pectinivora]